MREGCIQALLGFFRSEEGICGGSSLQLAVNTNGPFRLNKSSVLTEPENMGWGVPGRGLARLFVEMWPLGPDKGVCGLDIISWP